MRQCSFAIPLHTACRAGAGDAGDPVTVANGCAAASNLAFHVALDGKELVLPLAPALRGLALAAARRREQV